MWNRLRFDNKWIWVVRNPMRKKPCKWKSGVFPKKNGCNEKIKNEGKRASWAEWRMKKNKTQKNAMISCPFYVMCLCRCCVVQLPMDSWIFGQWTRTCRWSWNCCTIQSKHHHTGSQITQHKFESYKTEERKRMVHRKFLFEFGNKPSKLLVNERWIHEGKKLAADNGSIKLCLCHFCAMCVLGALSSSIEWHTNFILFCQPFNSPILCVESSNGFHTVC